MNMRYPLIAAAVAIATSAGTAYAAVPTLAQAITATTAGDYVVIAGSSAAQTAVGNAIGVDLCGGTANELTISSTGNKNFFAYSCSLAHAVGSIASGTIVTFYYRSEGGSVVGALPIATGYHPKRLNLSDASCTASGSTGTCAVTGTTATNGPGDSWTGAVTPDAVMLGITDVEPAQLTGLDYPSNYTPGVWGTATASEMAGLAKAVIIQQVFGLAVNTSGMTLNSANNGAVNLSRESAANILSGNYSDWAHVPDALTGNPITTNSPSIVHVDREPGSGTRTATNIYFLGYQCGTANAIISGSGETLNYSTSDELTLANNTPGSISYASIDNLLPPKNTAYTNLVLATLNGVVPSTLAAAAGQYDFWYEATALNNPANTGASAALASYLVDGTTGMGAIAYAPSQKDINVVPNLYGNTGTVPLTQGTQSYAVYVNPYHRSGDSCNVPGETN
jgi:hypothetical protein